MKEPANHGYCNKLGVRLINWVFPTAAVETRFAVISIYGNVSVCVET